jgi:quinolinate synthase
MNSIAINNQILKLKRELGNRIIIPAHHYEDPKVVEVADFVGDSYKLAVDCAKTDAEFIVFCGVYFMAEAADVLSQPNQKVIMPDLAAGCPMADQINKKQAEEASKVIQKRSSKQIVPVVYMNSFADIKSFCGERGGSVCTSSNASEVIEFYLKQDNAVFFAPDFNLGINTARKLGLNDDEIVKIGTDLNIENNYDPDKVKLYIWDGLCHVHKVFAVQDIVELRAEYEAIKIIVHPECDRGVVNNSDISGSTQKIYNEIKNSPAGSVWGVGTEYNFVQRIADEFPDKTVLPLKRSICHNMAKITSEKLLTSLGSINAHIEEGLELKNIVSVDEEDKGNAANALNKMIEIVEKK